VLTGYMNSVRMLRQGGATLLELMVTVSVAGVLVGAAVPAFLDFSVRNRIVSYSNEFIGTVNLARSEAIRRGATVSICHSNDNSTCSGTWSDGWIVFVNTDGDSPAAVDAGETLIRAYPALESGFTLNSIAALATDVTFGSDGSARGVGAMAVCHAGSLVNASAIIITRLRPRVGKDTNNDKIPNVDDGTNLATCSPA
jgi:type IV fimbrial biogenesis protein FimT